MIIIKNRQHEEKIPSTEEEVLALTQQTFKELGTEQEAFIVYCTQRAIFLDIKYLKFFSSSNFSAAKNKLDRHIKENSISQYSKRNFLLPNSTPTIDEIEGKWRNLDLEYKIAFIILGLLGKRETLTKEEQVKIVELCLNIVSDLDKSALTQEELEKLVTVIVNADPDRATFSLSPR